MDDESSQQAHCASPKDNTDVVSTHDFSDDEIDNEEDPYYEETPRELRGYTRSGRPVYSVRRLLVPYPGKDHAKDMQDLEACEADPDMEDKNSTDGDDENDENNDDEDEYHECEEGESDGEDETESESEGETESEEEDEEVEMEEGDKLEEDLPLVRNLHTQ